VSQRHGVCSFIILLSIRQIPYAIGQFTVNELCHEVVYRNMSEEAKRSLSGAAQFNIALGSGIIAGFAAAILSQVRKVVILIIE
jgi:solute carrier family 25 (mitochondrial phosphate transporter), member 3